MFKDQLLSIDFKDILLQFNKNITDFKNVYADSLSSSLNPNDKINDIVKNIRPDESFSLIEILVSNNDAEINSKMFKQNPDHRRYFTFKEIIQFTEDVSHLDFFIRKEIELSIIGKVDVGFFFFKLK